MTDNYQATQASEQAAKHIVDDELREHGQHDLEEEHQETDDEREGRPADGEG